MDEGARGELAQGPLSLDVALRVLAGTSPQVQQAITVLLTSQLQGLQDKHAEQMHALLAQREEETQRLRDLYAQRQAQLEHAPPPPPPPEPVVEQPAPVAAAPALDHLGLIALIRQVAIEVAQSVFRDHTQQAVMQAPQTMAPATPTMQPLLGMTPVLPVYNPHAGRRW